MRDFLRYITRPSGFGRTQWVPAAIIHLAYLGMIIQRIWWNSTAALFVFYFGLFLCFMFWIATWRNWKVDRKGVPRHPNNHYPDVCENCDPVCMKDGGPIPNMTWWYATTHGLTREQAGSDLDRMDAAVWRFVRDEYRLYLKHPKFQ